MQRFRATFDSLGGHHLVRCEGKPFMTMGTLETAGALAQLLNGVDALAAEMNEPTGVYEDRDEFNRVKIAYTVCKALGLGDRLDLVGPRPDTAAMDEGERHAVR